MKFKELKQGQEFDWIDDDNIGYNSFFKRCIKTAQRTYKDTDGNRYSVGSINAVVFHVEPLD